MMQNNKYDLDDNYRKQGLNKNKENDTKDSSFPNKGINNKKFTGKDFSTLSENEHYRYAKNSKKIGHVVITQEGCETVALQYDIPTIKDGKKAPTVRPLINITAIQPYPGMHRFRAQTPDTFTPMYGKRSIYGKVGNNDGEDPFQIVCFSPPPKENQAPFWGSIKETPLFNDKLSKSDKEELKEELAEIKQITKGGPELKVDHSSVPKRDLKKNRNPSQNKVMGESARDAYQNFFEAMVDELHPDMKKRLRRSFEADIRSNFFKNSHRPEWLHLYGWSLTPINKNPQTKDNLGAAPKWANTQMMVLERIVKWFAINAPKSLLTIKPRFDMLLDTELVKHIDFSVRVKIKERYVELIQSIDPFLAYPLFAKASDLAQGTAITYNILNKNDPVSKQVVKTDTSKGDEGLRTIPLKRTESILTKNLSTQTDLVTSEFSPQEKNKTQHNESHSERNKSKSRRHVKESPIKGFWDEKQDNQPSTSHRKKGKGNNVELLEPKQKNTKFPTQNQHERSVVQIYSDLFIADYDNPWRGPQPASCTGSGFVVKDNSSNKKYVVTNAHVAENTTFLQVRLANNRIKKFEAKVKCVSYQCDLALLEVENREFQKLVEPVDLGEMVHLWDRIKVVGFPMGGTEISLSKGIVSRIQVDSYSMSGQYLLQAQIDAAVNPGNSGGPVFMGNKVIGVAFQGYNKRQGLSYIIPTPILKHFLTEALSGKKYRGFPTIPVVTEEIENPTEREYYKMGTKSGIRVLKADNLSDAYNKLKPDDILLAIDGLAISNEGTVDIPGIGNCIDYFHVTQSKFVGDSVKLNVLRKKPGTDDVEELEVDVRLDTIAGETEKVSVPEHDKMPTYYINSGICFVPLTRNYMEGNGFDFEEIYLAEENCFLPDAPKKNPNEQIIVINTILNCKKTQGYDKHIRAIVKEINNTKINNIHDVVRAMEKNRGKNHVISLASKSKIVIPNMSKAEHLKLLERNHIPKDRSTDLSNAPVDVQGLQSVSETKLNNRFNNLDSIPRISPSSGFFSPPQLNKQNVPNLKEKNLPIIFSDDEENEEKRSTISNQEEFPLQRSTLPGLRRWQETLLRMEQYYKDHPEEEDNDEEYSVRDEDSAYSDEQESESNSHRISI